MPRLPFPGTYLPCADHIACTLDWCRAYRNHPDRSSAGLLIIQINQACLKAGRILPAFKQAYYIHTKGFAAAIPLLPAILLAGRSSTHKRQGPPPPRRSGGRESRGTSPSGAVCVRPLSAQDRPPRRRIKQHLPTLTGIITGCEMMFSGLGLTARDMPVLHPYPSCQFPQRRALHRRLL